MIINSNNYNRNKNECVITIKEWGRGEYKLIVATKSRMKVYTCVFRTIKKKG